jgi:hypothetical protein
MTIFRFYSTFDRHECLNNYICNLIVRGGAEVARWAHNPKVTGSSPVPATNRKAAYLAAFCMQKRLQTFSEYVLFQRNFKNTIPVFSLIGRPGLALIIYSALMFGAYDFVLGN